jgi:hypothetical protein
MFPPLLLLPVREAANEPSTTRPLNGSIKKLVLVISSFAVSSISPPLPPLILETSMLSNVMPPVAVVSLTVPPWSFGCTRTG